MKIDSCGKNGLVRLQLFLCGLCVPVLMTRGLQWVQRAWSRGAPIHFCWCPSLGHEGLLCSVRLSSLSSNSCPDGEFAVSALPTQVWEHLVQLSVLTFPQFLIFQFTETYRKDIGKLLEVWYWLESSSLMNTELWFYPVPSRLARRHRLKMQINTLWRFFCCKLMGAGKNTCKNT